MRLDLEEAVSRVYLRPTDSWKIIDRDNEDNFQKSFLFEKEPEVLTWGHTATEKEPLSVGRICKLEERAVYSDYGKLLPIWRAFLSMVPITSYVISFITKCRVKSNKKVGRNVVWSGPLLKESSLWFSAFPMCCFDSCQKIPWIHTTLSDTSYSDRALIDALSEDLKPVALAYFLKTHSSMEASNQINLHSLLPDSSTYYWGIISKKLVMR